VALYGVLALTGTACVGDDALGSNDRPGGDASAGDSATIPTKLCNGVTVPTNDPKTGCAQDACDPCGAADHQRATCSAGKCAVECDTGFTDCDPAKAGCETNTAGDAVNCGKCGNVCGKTANTTAAVC